MYSHYLLVPQKLAINFCIPVTDNYDCVVAPAAFVLLYTGAPFFVIYVFMLLRVPHSTHLTHQRLLLYTGDPFLFDETCLFLYCLTYHISHTLPIKDKPNHTFFCTLFSSNLTYYSSLLHNSC